jgi:hypothetical protein
MNIYYTCISFNISRANILFMDRKYFCFWSCWEVITAVKAQLCLTKVGACLPYKWCSIVRPSCIFLLKNGIKSVSKNSDTSCVLLSYDLSLFFTKWIRSSLQIWIHWLKLLCAVQVSAGGTCGPNWVQPSHPVRWKQCSCWCQTAANSW